MVCQAANGPVMTEISQLDGGNRLNEARAVFLHSTKAMVLLSAFLGAVLILNGKAIITMWVGPQFLASYSLLVILTVGYIVAFGQEPCRLVIFSQGRYHRALAWWTLAEGLTNVLLSIYLVKRYGLVGIALGTTVPYILVKLLVHPWYALRSIGLPLRTYLRRALLRPVAAAALFFVLFIPLGAHFNQRDAFSLIQAIAGQTAIFGVLAYAIALDGPERRCIQTYTKQLSRAVRLSGA
jgi:O-antigen/teichoic acid export membrane protein